MKQPSFQEELAAHLDSQKQPLPHPQRYDLGSAHQRHLDAQRLREMGLQHPGPITMHESCCDEEAEMLADENRSMEMLALCLVLILIGVIIGSSLLVWGAK